MPNPNKIKKTVILSFIFFMSVSNMFAQPFKFNWQQCYFSEHNGKNLERPNIVKADDGYLILFNEDINSGGSYFNWDISLIKTDNEGNFLWKKKYGGSGLEGADGIVPSNNGNFIIAGTLCSTDIGIDFPEYLPLGGIWIFMIDSLGNRIWDKLIGSDQCCVGYGANFSPTPDGGILCSFNICNSGGDVTQYFGSFDIWMVKISATGQLEWDFTLGSDWFDGGGALLKPLMEDIWFQARVT